MLATLLTLLPKMLMALGMRLLSEELLEDLLIWSLTKLSESTKTKVDDELLELAKKHLNK